MPSSQQEIKAVYQGNAAIVTKEGNQLLSEKQSSGKEHVMALAKEKELSKEKFTDRSLRDSVESNIKENQQTVQQRKDQIEGAKLAKEQAFEEEMVSVRERIDSNPIKDVATTIRDGIATVVKNIGDSVSADVEARKNRDFFGQEKRSSETD
jgi:hypothetical protein